MWQDTYTKPLQEQLYLCVVFVVQVQHQAQHQVQIRLQPRAQARHLLWIFTIINSFFACYLRNAIDRHCKIEDRLVSHSWRVGVDQIG